MDTSLDLMPERFAVHLVFRVCSCDKGLVLKLLSLTFLIYKTEDNIQRHFAAEDRACLLVVQSVMRERKWSGYY